MAEIGSLVFNVAGNITGATNSLKSLEQTSRTSAQRIERNLNNVKTNVIESKITSLRDTMAGLATAGIIRSVADVGVQFESINASLEALTGSTRGGLEAFEFLQENSKQLGVNLLASARDFRILVGAAKGSGFAMEDLEKTFTAVSKASLVMGMRADDVTGVMRALGQMMSKGKVQAEELKGQIGDRLYGAIEKAARAMNMTTGELFKAMEMGELFTEDFLMNFVRVIDEDFSGGVEKMRQQTLYALNDMSNAWLELQNFIASEGGLNTAIRETATALAELMRYIQTDNFKSMAEDVKLVVGAFIAYKALGMINVLSTQNGAMSGLKNTIVTTATATGLFNKGMVAVGTNLATGTVMATRQSVALATLRTSLIGLGTTIATMLPQALIAAGIAFAVFHKSAKEKIEDLGNSIGVVTQKTIGQKLSTVYDELYNQEKRLKELQSGKGFSFTSDDTISQTQKNINRLKSYIKELLAQQEELNKKPIEIKETGIDKVSDKVKKLNSELEKIISQSTMSDYEKELDNINRQYNEWIESTGKVTPEIQKAYEVLRQAKFAEWAEETGKYFDELNEKRAKPYIDTISRLNDELIKLSMTDFESGLLNALGDVTDLDQQSEITSLYQKVFDSKVLKEFNEENKKIAEDFDKDWEETFLSQDEKRAKWVEKWKQAGIDIEKVNQLATEKFKSEWEKTIDDMNDLSLGFKNTTENALKGLEDAFVEFARTGKMNMRDMADAIIADLMRVAVRRAIIAPIMGGLGAAFPTVFGTAYNGGIATSSGFQRFSDGGIVGSYSNVDSPSRDTIPALISEGEAVIPASVVSRNKELIKALISSRTQKFSNGFVKGGTGGVTTTQQPMKVEIINESGDKMEVKSTKQRNDIEGQVLSIVINAIHTNKMGMRTAIGGR